MKHVSKDFLPAEEMMQRKKSNEDFVQINWYRIFDWRANVWLTPDNWVAG
jgi:hypothetical protein